MCGLDSITIELLGQPVPWKAATVTRHGAYSPAKYKAWKTEATLRARLQYGECSSEPMTGPIGLEIWVRWATHEPDLTNVVKGTEDALEAAGVFPNDRQVVEQRNYKMWDRENPGVRVRVWRVESVNTLLHSAAFVFPDANEGGHLFHI